MNYERLRRFLPILFIVVLLMLSAGLFILSSQKSSGDKLPEDSNIDISSQASIENGQQVLSAVGSVEAYESLSEDLYVFAKTAYGEYSSSSSIVSFEVSDKPTTQNNETSLSGKFGSVDHEIEVKVAKMKNKRISVSITDTANKLSIDQNLPSNSARNAFISTLPISANVYLIEYSESDDGFMISLYSDNSAELDAATNEAQNLIKQGLEVESLASETIHMQRPTSSFGY